jgi:peptidoglycan-associated lipoprotein
MEDSFLGLIFMAGRGYGHNEKGESFKLFSLKERRTMMKRNIVWVGLISLALCFSMTSLIGCAKKAILKEGAVAAQEESAVAQASAAEEAAPVVAQSEPKPRKSVAREQAATSTSSSDKAAAKEEADKAAREAAEKAEKAAAEKAAAEKAAREAAEKAKQGAEQKAAAVLKELQVANISFDYDKYNLRPEAQEILKAGAPAYLKYKDFKLVVEGHCDERGTAEYNLALGEKRATEAANYLTDLGIDKERIKTISYGKEMPLDNGHDEEAWAKNRRAQFVIVAPAK